MAENHVARVRITFEMLVEFLRLPPDTKIIGVRSHELIEVVELLIHHPDLKPAQRGDVTPIAEPGYRKYPDGQMHFLDWGQDRKRSSSRREFL